MKSWFKLKRKSSKYVWCIWLSPNDHVAVGSNCELYFWVLIGVKKEKRMGSFSKYSLLCFGSWINRLVYLMTLLTFELSSFQNLYAAHLWTLIFWDSLFSFPCCQWGEELAYSSVGLNHFLIFGICLGFIPHLLFLHWPWNHVSNIDCHIPWLLFHVVSGLSGSKETAQSQVSVGMGLLAGSTVMLLTVIWGSCVIVGKCDIQDSTAKDSQNTKRCSLTGMPSSIYLYICSVYPVVLFIISFRWTAKFWFINFQQSWALSKIAFVAYP